MELIDKNVLFFTRSMGLGGTENVILQLCEILKGQVNKIIVCSCGGLNTEKLKDMGIIHYEIPDIERKSIKTILQTSKILKKIVKKEKIDIIHTHHRMAAFYVTFFKLYKKCIFISTAHNTFTDKKFLTKYSYKHCNVVACGEAVRRNFIEYYGLSEERVITIHNSVKEFEGDFSALSILESCKKNGYTIVGSIGRLSEQKGMEYFIKAIPLVLQACPKTKFFIVGTGEKETELKQLALSLNIDDFLNFMGYRSDIQNVMSQMDLIVLSSLWEGLPLTPIEAFSVGKTVIATAVDGTTEIVRDGENGYLVPPKNSEFLAERIIELIKNETLRRTFAENAIETFKSEFSFECFSENIIEFYKNI